MYKVKLTPWNICYLVFYVDRLRSAKQATLVPECDLLEPPLAVVDEEEEYKIEKILDAQIYWRKF